MLRVRVVEAMARDRSLVANYVWPSNERIMRERERERSRAGQSNRNELCGNDSSIPTRVNDTEPSHGVRYTRA